MTEKQKWVRNKEVLCDSFFFLKSKMCKMTKWNNMQLFSMKTVGKRAFPKKTHKSLQIVCGIPLNSLKMLLPAFN